MTTPPADEPAEGDGFAALVRYPVVPDGPQYDVSELARPWRRLVALVVDGVVVALLVGALRSTTGTDAGWGAALLALAVAVVYEVGFLVTVQATPGRSLLGVRVERTVGEPITVATVLLRFGPVVLPGTLAGAGPLGLVASAWVLVDHLWALHDADRRTLHDRIAGTVVLRSR